MHDKSVDCNSAPAGPGADATRLYDAFAPRYDQSFEAPSLRAVYDQLAWETTRALLPTAPATLVDVGCGTGRWVSRCLALSHTVVGIEPSTAMQDILVRKFADSNFQLIASAAETAEVPEGSVDAVLAMGSLQYADDAVGLLKRMTLWLRPGGVLCVHVDGLVALTIELMRLGRREEALTRLDQRRGVFTCDDVRAPLHLFDASALSLALAAAGLEDVQTRGLLVAPTIFGREQCERDVVADYDAFLDLERRFCRTSEMSDAGKHVLAWGRRPP